MKLDCIREFLILFILLGLYLSPSISSYAFSKDTTNSEVLKIGTMDLPPYGWQTKSNLKRGIIYEMNQEIGIRSGLKFTNQILPFKRMLMLLKKGKLDLVSSQAHSLSLDAGDKLAIQFKINIIAGTKKNSDIYTINQFKNKHLAYHRAASYSQLEGLPKKISRVNSYRQILLLIHTRPLIHGGIFSEPAYYYWMQELGLSPNDFGNTILIEAGKKQWIIVRKDMAKKKRQKLTKIITEIYSENLYERLLRKYGKK
jgi:ABC-type amino acid transport substrate-binding protein